MRTCKWKTQTLALSGFTLIELLAVIAIIVMMAIVAVSATNSIGASSKQGAILASSVFALARSEAIQKQGYSALVVDAYPDPGNPGNYLHRLMVADVISVGNSVPNILTTSGPNTLQQVSPWYDLPMGVYFDPTYSYTSTSSASGVGQNGTVPLLITKIGSTETAFQGSAFAYTFTPTGQLFSACQFIVAAGHEPIPAATPLYEDGTAGTSDTLQGFYFHMQGRPSFFQSSLAITSSVSTH